MQLSLSDFRNPWKIGFNWLIISLCRLLPPGNLKNSLLRMIGVKIGKNVWISPDVILDPVFPELITLKDNVFIGWGARLFTHMITHERQLIKGKITINKGAFIGGFTTIRPGVTIGNHAVIGSDSLVNAYIPSRAMARGVPARVIKWLKKGEEPIFK